MGSIKDRGGVVEVVAEFQCSPTSRVGVNGRTLKCVAPEHSVSVLSDEPCWGQLDRPIGTVSVYRCFSALRRAVLGSMSKCDNTCATATAFQCSPTSRVGVNPRHPRPHPPHRPVSVLSDEPCWGQSPRTNHDRLGKIVSVLSDEPCWGQSEATSSSAATS